MDENTTPALGTAMWGKLSWMILKNNEMNGAVPDGEGEVSVRRVISDSWRQRGEKEDILRNKREAQHVVGIGYQMMYVQRCTLQYWSLKRGDDHQHPSIHMLGN